MSHLYNNQSQSPVHHTPLPCGGVRGRVRCRGAEEGVMRTEYTTYKPYEKATIATSQYRYYGTAVPIKRY